MLKKQKDGAHQRDTEANLKKFLEVKAENLCNEINNIVLNYKPECETNIHEPTMVYTND